MGNLGNFSRIDAFRQQRLPIDTDQCRPPSKAVTIDRWWRISTGDFKRAGGAVTTGVPRRLSKSARTNV
jgi:hypothetical protein